jgi:hypothetical protein
MFYKTNNKPHKIQNTNLINLSSIQIYSTTMMNLNLFLAFAALVTAATGSVVDDTSILPTGVYTPPVELGTASNYVILTKTGIASVFDSHITGDVGVSPIHATAITGFGLTMDPSGQSSTSSQIDGKAYAADYAPPTPSELTTAVDDMEAAYTDAAGRPNEDDTRTNLGGGDISGEVLTPGVYTFDVDISFTADIAFRGSINDVFIIQTTEKLLQGAGTKVNLLGGAQAKNIFWQVAGNASVGADSELQGVLLVKTDVVFVTGSSLNGRVFAQTACNLQLAVIAEPPLER